MNLYESIKSNHNRKVPKRFIKESAEGGKEFWDKVDAGEIKIGGQLDSDGAGDIDVLDLDKNADYILIKRNSDYQPFVAAWAPEFYNGKLTWGQGHYFDKEDDARAYFNQKALRECDKKEIKETCGKKKRSSIKEGEIVNNKFVMEPGDTEKFEKVYTESSKYDGIWGKYLGVARFDNYLIFSDLANNIVIDIVNNTVKKVDHNGTELQFTDSDLEALYNTVHDEALQEACSKKKRPSLKESNPARYLGVKSVLDEAINHANDDINAKIKEALRSKTAARKYKKDLEAAGIKIDDTPREGVNLIGPNGRILSADRLNIYGPARPGHGKTHDSTSRWGGAKSMREDLKSYDSSIKKDKEHLAAIENMQRDDIIRKYSNKSTEEALDLHKKDIEREQSNLDWDKRWRKDKIADLERLHRDRDVAHRSKINDYDREISRDAKYKDPNNKEGYGYSNVADAIDYKGYLDSKNNNENKDFDYNGRAPRTKGQIARNEFKNAKADVENTYYWGSDARRDREDKAIDAKAIEQRKKEIEEEYKKKMDDEVNSMLARKSKADASYAEHKNSYNDKVNKLNAMRSKLGLQTKDEQSFDDYLEKKSQSRY
jgi:hypothetical protein